MKKFLCVFLSIFLIVLSGCTVANAEIDNEKINIVATIFPEYDFAKAITGDRANVSMLIQPGASIHSFDPSPADIKKVQNADIFIYVGGESEVWADNILQSLNTSEIKIIRLMDHVNTVNEEIKEGMEHEHKEHAEDHHEDEDQDQFHEAEAVDEHIWTSPKNALKLIDVICTVIAETDSENAEHYKDNAAKYKEELKEIDREITEVVESAKHNKIVVADKFPFRYFVDAYGLDYEAAFPGCSDQADAGAKTIVHLVNAVKNEGIEYVYYVELSNKNVAFAISEETGAQMLLLNSCHNVSKTDFDKGITYISLMKDNIESLRKGLN